VGRLALERDIAQGKVDAGEHRLVYGPDQALLGAEVVDDQAWRDAGSAGHPPQRARGHALASEELHCGVADPRLGREVRLESVCCTHELNTIQLFSRVGPPVDRRGRGCPDETMRTRLAAPSETPRGRFRGNGEGTKSAAKGAP